MIALCRHRALAGLALSAAFMLPGAAASGQAAAERKNSLGMVFIPLGDSGVSISAWETRVSDWMRHVEAAGGGPWHHLPAFAQGDDHPVVNVTRDEAASFCLWLTQAERAAGQIAPAQSYRLPTSAEWSFAAGVKESGSTPSSATRESEARFPWGLDWPPLRQSANVNSAMIPGGKDDGYRFTAPAGQFAPAASGVSDLGGNVWEWTLDAGESKQTGSLRGGSWLQWQPDTLRAGHAQKLSALARLPSVGFRCVFEDANVMRRKQQLASAASQKRQAEVLGQGVATKEEIDRMAKELTAKAAAKPTTDKDKAALGKDTVSQEDVKRVLGQITGVKEEKSASPQPSAVKPKQQRP